MLTSSRSCKPCDGKTRLHEAVSVIVLRGTPIRFYDQRGANARIRRSLTETGPPRRVAQEAWANLVRTTRWRSHESLPTDNGFDELLGDLSYLNAEEEAEPLNSPKDPVWAACSLGFSRAVTELLAILG
jgi:hypothetical protein